MNQVLVRAPLASPISHGQGQCHLRVKVETMLVTVKADAELAAWIAENLDQFDIGTHVFISGKLAPPPGTKAMIIHADHLSPDLSEMAHA